jgi:hypothetical protein
MERNKGIDTDIGMAKVQLCYGHFILTHSVNVLQTSKYSCKGLDFNNYLLQLLLCWMMGTVPLSQSIMWPQGSNTLE